MRGLELSRPENENINKCFHFLLRRIEKAPPPFTASRPQGLLCSLTKSGTLHASVWLPMTRSSAATPAQCSAPASSPGSNFVGAAAQVRPRCRPSMCLRPCRVWRQPGQQRRPLTGLLAAPNHSRHLGPRWHGGSSTRKPDEIGVRLWTAFLTLQIRRAESPATISHEPKKFDSALRRSPGNGHGRRICSVYCGGGLSGNGI